MNTLCFAYAGFTVSCKAHVHARVHPREHARGRARVHHREQARVQNQSCQLPTGCELKFAPILAFIVLSSAVDKVITTMVIRPLDDPT